MKTRFTLSCLAVLALFCLTSIARAAEPAGEKVGSVPVPDELNEKEVRTVIGETFLGRRWTVDNDGEHVVGHLVHRGFDATVTAVHRDGRIELYCDAWKINRRGERKEREIPHGWIDNLLKDFPVRLTRAALHSS